MTEKKLADAEKITAVITDLDGTLWAGILAEKQELKLDKEYYAMLKSIYQKGIQLFVVSKNDAEDVYRAFKELGVDRNIFTAIIANWDPKYLNIERLVNVTQLRPETIVFVDDNALERKEVGKKLPEIYAVDAQDWSSIEKVKFLKEKKEQGQAEIDERMNRYKISIDSHKLDEEIKEDPEFLKTLQRKLSINRISPDYLDRFTKLLVTTHRINFNPYKFDDYDKTLDYLHKKMNEGYCLYAVSVFEQGVSLGLSGALVVDVRDKKAVVEDGTFSCGIIGRDFEQKAILALADLLRKDEISELLVNVKFTSTNVRVREIFEDLGFETNKKTGENVVYSVNLENFNPKNDYGWIEVVDEPLKLAYYGIVSVMKFFEKNVLPLFKEKSKVVSLGAAQGEVIGLLQKTKRDEFYRLIEDKKVDYNKIDLEDIKGEGNIVADAEDLSGIIKGESQDLVLAIELLEHTEHFWKAVNEMIRVCKIGGHIFVTVPSFDYPKHEYPIDLWRIGPKTLKSFFPEGDFEVVEFEAEGDEKFPRRSMILVKNIRKCEANCELPKTGKVNWKTGLTVLS
ncbi:MAG: HAD-IIIC family phosphatase [Nanoarchaeota archaeon]|nr:HAD-IIIC family phosphatase [Nanoarchaeota archaeon]MBU1051905.1 HAD-IIIC family phosphatase [Nanoarchaeota archaeon]MBU1988948.1 HAD-IIIC family phosphatase [Nanoarchaeota archaeon]